MADGIYSSYITSGDFQADVAKVAQWQVKYFASGAVVGQQEWVERVVKAETTALKEAEIITHGYWQCAGSWCCVHNPSMHHMREWPLVHRVDFPKIHNGVKYVLSERTCRHGVGHPDPDSMSYLIQNTGDLSWGLHGCDGCCKPPTYGPLERGLAREVGAA